MGKPVDIPFAAAVGHIRVLPEDNPVLVAGILGLVAGILGLAAGILGDNRERVEDTSAVVPGIQEFHLFVGMIVMAIEARLAWHMVKVFQLIMSE